MSEIAKTKKIAFERAQDVVADWLADYRTDFACNGEPPTENERLMAGHIVGRLWAENLLNTEGEKWIPIESES